MGNGDPQIRLAARRLTALQDDMRQPHSRPADGQPAAGPAAHSPSLVNLGVLEQMERAYREVVEETRLVAPQAGPAPHGPGVYGWMEDYTAGLADQRAQVRAAMVYRHSLQHALAAGRVLVIRRESCPACGCWSLIWDKDRQRAACGVRLCVDERGRPSVWTLAQLAEKAVEETSERVAT